MEKNNNNKVPLALSFENPLEALFTLAKTYKSRTCMVEPRGNMVRKYSIEELANLVEKIARAIAKTRNGETKPIAIITHSSFRAIAANLGALLGGGKTIILPVNSTAEEQQHIIADNQVELLIVDNVDSTSGLLEDLPFLPQLRQIWSLEDEPNKELAEISTLGWHDMLHLADQGKRRTTLEQQLKDLNSKAKLCRFYSRNKDDFNHHDYSLNEIVEETKNAMLAAKAKHPSFNNTSNFLSIIPFNRVISHINGIYLPLLTGRILMAVDRQEAWKSAALPYTPDCIVSESEFLANAAEKITSEVEEHGGIAQFSFQKNLNRLRKNANSQKDGIQNNGKSMINIIAGKTVHYILHKKLLEIFGGNINLCFSIDKGLDLEHKLFYNSVAIPLIENHEKDLIANEANDKVEGLAFSGVRGVQLAKDKELDKLKIVS